ncbi:class I SAM-dependent DNA methyltransferase [Melioribacter sp. OK-6-Me]|uniref:class I SAM-dependent DNA methyltransferase n=1 Tax=unclassified Melioribacter TaxID=2627329 RepID=UPI003EDA2831
MKSRKVPQYSALAKIYGHLMRSIDYNDWAKYLLDIAAGLDTQNCKVLELAAGTGELARLLSNKFTDYVAIDSSYDMLSIANAQVKLVCCDMTLLPFKNKFNLIFSTFDSINYLTEKEKLKMLFAEVERCLETTGIFTFDVSLEFNSIKNAKYLNRSGKYGKIKYTQKSYYDKKERIHYNNFEIIMEDGTKYYEEHRQRIYSIEEYLELIDSTGLYVVNCFDAFTFNDVKKDSERAQFILKKKSC